jgi:hypothetical protein
MSIDRIYFAYMALAGAAAGLALATFPRLQDFALPPYFWVLIAAAVFEAAAYLRGRNAPGTMLGMNARFIGFIIGIALMVAITLLSGAPVRFI